MYRGMDYEISPCNTTLNVRIIKLALHVSHSIKIDNNRNNMEDNVIRYINIK